MTISDYIQLSIATVAGIAAILTAINIQQTNKQVILQKKQWEHSQVPIFFIDHHEDGRGYDINFGIQNTNNVYYQVKEVTFSQKGVEVVRMSNGYLTKQDKFVSGISIRVKSNVQGLVEGYLQVSGKDALGNDFTARSLPIRIEDNKLKNYSKIIKSYLENQ